MRQKTKVQNEGCSRHPAATAARPEWWPRRLTRHQVGEQLRKSPTGVRRLEGKTLHPVIGLDQVPEVHFWAARSRPELSTGPLGRLTARRAR